MHKELEQFKGGDFKMGDYFTFTTPSFGEFDMQLSDVIGRRATFISANVSKQKICIKDGKFPMDEALEQLYEEIPEEIRCHIIETARGKIWIPSLFDVTGATRMSIFSDDMNRTRIRDLRGRYRGEPWWLDTTSVRGHDGKHKTGFHYAVDVDGGILDREKDHRALSFVIVFTMELGEAKKV